MFKRIVEFGLCCLLAVVLFYVPTCLCEESVCDDTDQILDYAMQQAIALGKSIEQDFYKESIYGAFDSGILEEIREIDFSHPVYAEHITIDDAGIESKMEELSLENNPIERQHVCFGTLFEASVGRNFNYAIWSERMSLYGALQGIESKSDLTYISLLYGKDSPSIVTAFVRQDGNTILTKTSIVYRDNNPEGYLQSGTFLMYCSNVWPGMEYDVITID